ncbi:MAG: alpha/beta fold hydrolase [Paracoccaceae bacterium]
MAEQPEPPEQPAREGDRALHSAIGRLTGGISPAAVATAYLDWSMHLLGSPSKQAELWAKALAPDGDAEPDAINGKDTRFDDPAWQAFPFNLIRQQFLRQEAWWDAATRDVHGLDPKHARIVNFATRQMLDMAAPTNFAATNPLVLKRTQAERGQNLVRGLENWLADLNAYLGGKRPVDPAFRVGDTLAATPGKVVFRNRLIELIRYTPTVPKLHPEPLLIVPAWIMKYYILDLSQQNSMVKYLCDQGFEVFMISWKNPGAEDADLGMQDYVDLGVRAALEQIADRGAARSVHAVGYCLGGTLLSIAASAMARDGDRRFATLTLLASQVDFSEPGELGLFINESQVAFLEDIMASQGYLDADQMAGAFRMLRSNDLIWSRVVRHYLLGERTPESDLMAWNADSTQMPARMHSEYLRALFLHNELAKGLYRVDDRPVALTDMRAPIFCVGTEKDHVSPWRSVYRLLLLTDTDVTFLLTNGGHNGGILSEPGHPGRHYRMRQKTEGDPHRSAALWLEAAVETPGSWWPVWADWLKQKSGAQGAPQVRKMKSLCDAPGLYVRG